MRVAPAIVLSADERAQLTKLVRSKRTSVRLAQRARIVLRAADGVQNVTGHSRPLWFGECEI